MRNEIKITIGSKEFWGKTTAVIEFAFNLIGRPIIKLPTKLKNLKGIITSQMKRF